MQKRLRDGMLIGLGCTAGCVDALSYLKLGHVFTANMTGNTVLLGIAIGQLHRLAALRAALALLGFGVGVAIATLMDKNIGSGYRVWPLPVTLILALECALLWLFAFGVRHAEAAVVRLRDLADDGAGPSRHRILEPCHEKACSVVDAAARRRDAGDL